MPFHLAIAVRVISCKVSNFPLVAYSIVSFGWYGLQMLAIGMYTNTSCPLF